MPNREAEVRVTMGTDEVRDGRRMGTGPARDRRPRCGLALAGTVGLLAFGILLPLGAASASAQGSAPAPAGTAATGNSGNTGSGSSSSAVITPLLKFFEFGNAIGLPLACSDAGSVVSIFGSQTSSESLTTPLTNELDSLCAQLASQGGTYLQQAIAQSQALVFINPVANPLIADLSNGAKTVGTTDGPSLAPFGPTVAGLGGTVSFFEGS